MKQAPPHDPPQGGAGTRCAGGQRPCYAPAMNAKRRSFRLTAVDPYYWEVAVVDTVFLPDGSQQRSLPFVHLVTSSQVAQVAQRMLEEHINEQMERFAQAGQVPRERD
jgi:hypothetical protein